MLLLSRNILQIIFVVFISILQISWAQYNLSSPPEEYVLNIKDIVKNLLTNIEGSRSWNENLHFGLIFAEFLIKPFLEKVRFYEPTRFEIQLYDEMIQIINRIREKIVEEHGVGRLAHILQRNVLLIKPILREHQIDSNLEFNSLMPIYDTLMEKRVSTPRLSDFCLLHISELENCNNLHPECLKMISSDTPTYGYQRVHQLVVLYLLMHHTCSSQYGSELTYQIWASHHCSQMYREHKILSGAASKRRRDLYIEQSSVCGLFGYKEYLNKSELKKIRQWEIYGFCDCVGKVYTYGSPVDNNVCICTDHVHSVSLVFYINAMLFLR